MSSNKKDKNKTKNTDKVKILDTLGIYKDVGDTKKIGTYKKNDSVKYTRLQMLLLGLGYLLILVINQIKLVLELHLVL